MTQSNSLTVNQSQRKKKKQSKKKAAKGRPLTSMRVSAGYQNQALIRMVCGITDPFCMAARTGKFPDGTMTQTVSFPLRARSILTTNASGDAAVLFVPTFCATLCSPSAIAGDVGTFSALTNFSIPANVAAYRINSWGLRLRNIAAPLSAAGMVRVRWLGNMTGSALTSINLSSYNAVFLADTPLQQVKDECVIGHRVNEDFHKLQAQNTIASVTDWVTNGWGPVTIYVNGGPPSVAALDIEIFVNYEYTFLDGDASNMFSTPVPPANPLVAAASSYAAKALGTVVSAGVKGAERFVYNKVKTFLASAVGGAVGGPAGAIVGGATGMILDVD